MSKVAIVTGGTKGIGKAIIEKFSSEGFDIATCSRNEKDLKHLKTRIEKQYKNEVYVQKVDVSDKKVLQQFAGNVLKWNSNIHILVNNAGVFIPGKITEEEDGSLEKMMSINTYSAYYLSRYIIDSMKNKKGAYIFNICSTASIMPYLNGGSYCISKHAMLGFSKILREELKEIGIRVSAVLPGATYTSSWEDVDLPESRFIKSSDIAETIWSAFSLSENTVIEELIVRPQLGDI
ncbi:SDR family oxidoreductase [Hyphobacterium sp. CCMP332]|nr:SDR family oxidoreductase [Hyphobacterium sp. CCMP332]